MITHLVCHNLQFQARIHFQNDTTPTQVTGKSSGTTYRLFNCEVFIQTKEAEKKNRKEGWRARKDYKAAKEDVQYHVQLKGNGKRSKENRAVMQQWQTELDNLVASFNWSVQERPMDAPVDVNIKTHQWGVLRIVAFERDDTTVGPICRRSHR